MNNVAGLHVYIAQMFSQFKENMEIYQGILDGPITQKKNLKDCYSKDWTMRSTQKIQNVDESTTIKKSPNKRNVIP